MSFERAIDIIKLVRIRDLAESKINDLGEAFTIGTAPFWSPESDQQQYWLGIYDVCTRRIDEAHGH